MRGAEGGGIGVSEELAYMEEVMNLHVGKRFKSTSGGKTNLRDEEPRLEFGNWVDVLEGEEMGGEMDHVTK